MALGAAEARSKKRLNQYPCGLMAQHEAPQADHIEIVILDALPCRKNFMDQAGADSGYLVGCDARTHAATTNGHRS
jgi:hypothetical protein